MEVLSIPMGIALGVILMMAFGLIVLYLRLQHLGRTHALEQVEAQQQLQGMQHELEQEKEKVAHHEGRFHTLQEEKTILERDYAVLHTRFEESSRSSAEKLKLLEEAKENLKIQFETLANQIFEQKSKTFEEHHKQRLELMLKPFREQIAHFSKQTEERFVKDTSDRAVLQKEISLLKTLNERISQDAINLTKALKGENKSQGNWGEIVLERILEESGLREGSEYETQGSFKDEEGKTLRPDVIVHLPQEKDIVIDSKVSLVAYEAFMKAEEPQEKERALKAHLHSINGHIKGLGEKHYERLEGVRTLDFVLLFMPIEGAFLLALEADSGFFKRAYEQNIIVVGPSTLLVTLRTIEHIWRTERQEQNAQEIVRQAENLYDKFVGFVADMEKIGKYLESTQGAYDGAMNKLCEGRGNLIRRAETMKELGLKPKNQLTLKGEDDA